MLLSDVEEKYEQEFKAAEVRVPTQTDLDGANIQLDLGALHHAQAKYTPEQKVAAAMAWLISGSSEKAAKLTGVSAVLIRNWKAKAPWWEGVWAWCQYQRNDEVLAKSSSIVLYGLDELKDRILNGDEIIDKDGNRLRRKVSARDLVSAVGIIMDKTQHLRAAAVNKPTLPADSKQEIARLGKEFERLSATIREKDGTLNKKLLSDRTVEPIKKAG